jgi:hypothetical protein
MRLPLSFTVSANRRQQATLQKQARFDTALSDS